MTLYNAFLIDRLSFFECLVQLEDAEYDVECLEAHWKFNSDSLISRPRDFIKYDDKTSTSQILSISTTSIDKTTHWIVNPMFIDISDFTKCQSWSDNQYAWDYF